MFNSYSAMVLHLEAGTCRSGTSCQTVNHAANYRMDIHWSGAGKHYLGYGCPDCKMTCRLMSGLLQHAESEHAENDHSRVLDRFGNFHNFHYHRQLDSFLDTLVSDIDDMLDYA